MKDYHGVYLIYEVLFSAKIFEKFTNNNLENYGLCPSHFLSAPALSWDAMLNMTKMGLKLILDPDIYIYLKNVQEVEFLIDMLQPTVSISNLMT